MSHGSKAMSSRRPRSVLISIMFEGTRVAVVVPAFDEELLIAKTIRGIPTFVDHIVVVDDCSRDATVARARETDDPRLEVVEHKGERRRRRRDRHGLSALSRARGRHHVRDGRGQPDGSR